jgi:hypothetical protein
MAKDFNLAYGSCQGNVIGRFTMNKFLIGNGLLLLSIMGFHQWYGWYDKAQGIAEFSLLQSIVWHSQVFVQKLCPSATEDYVFFALASLIVPIVMMVKAKKIGVPRRAIAVMTVLNLALFYTVGVTSARSTEPNTWTAGQLLGAPVIGNTNNRPAIADLILPSVLTGRSDHHDYASALSAPIEGSAKFIANGIAGK